MSLATGPYRRVAHSVSDTFISHLFSDSVPSGVNPPPPKTVSSPFKKKILKIKVRHRPQNTRLLLKVCLRPVCPGQKEGLLTCFKLNSPHVLTLKSLKHYTQRTRNTNIIPLAQTQAGKS